MGNTETREELFCWNLNPTERRRLLYDGKNWIWKAEGKIPGETIVDIVFENSTEIRPHAILTLTSEQKQWNSWNHGTTKHDFQYMHMVITNDFEQIEQPPVDATTQKIGNLFCNGLIRNTKDLIWLQNKHPKLQDFAFGIGSPSLTVVTVTPRELSHMPFKYVIWLISMVNAKYPRKTKTRSIYIAVRGTNFPKNYQFKSWSKK